MSHTPTERGWMRALADGVELMYTVSTHREAYICVHTYACFPIKGALVISCRTLNIPF